MQLKTVLMKVMKYLDWILVVFAFLCFSCSDGTKNEPFIPEKPEVSEPPQEEEEDTTPLVLNVVGRYLKDAEGKVVNLHGFGQTFSPFFNNGAWDNYDVAACLRYNKGLIDQILAAGWRMNFVRMHMDPYWSDDPNQQSVRYEGHERFSEARFKKYLNEVFVPMAEYAIGKGLFVVFRPPGVSPEKIAVYDDYQTFLIKVWDIVSQHAKLKNNGHVMFELANEPIHILGPDGTYAGSGDGHFKNLKQFFQTIRRKTTLQTRTLQQTIMKRLQALFQLSTISKANTQCTAPNT